MRFLNDIKHVSGHDVRKYFFNVVYQSVALDIKTLVNRGFLVSVVLVAVFWIPAYVNMPFGRDQGIFMWVADTILHGGLPYADAWDVKGPAAHFTAALAVLLFGHTEMAIRLLDLLFLLGACVAYLWLLRPLLGLVPAVAASAMLFILSRGHYWILAQPDLWASIAVLGATSLVVRPGRYPSAAFLGVGLLLAYAVLTKPLFILFAIPLIVYVWLRERRQAVRPVLLIVAGLALPTLVFFLLFFTAGKFGSLWEVQWQFNIFTYASLHENSFKTLVLSVLRIVSSPLAISLATCVGLTYFYRRHPGVTGLLLAQYLIGWAILILQDKFYVYHAWTFFVFSAALAAGIFAPISQNPPGFFRKITVPILVSLILLSVYFPLRAGLNWWMWVTNNRTYATYVEYFETEDFGAEELHDVAAYVKAHSNPQDQIFLWGFEAGIYFLAERYPPTRIGVNTPVIVSVDPHRAQLYAELLKVLRTHPPRFVIVQDLDNNNLYPKTSVEYLEEDFLELCDWIAKHYRAAYSNNRFKVYEQTSSVEITENGTEAILGDTEPSCNVMGYNAP